MAISIIRIALATGSGHHHIYHRDQVSKFTIIDPLKNIEECKIVWDCHCIMRGLSSLSGSGWNPNSSGDRCQGWWLMVFMAPLILHTLHPGPRHLPCPSSPAFHYNIIPALDKQWHTIITHTAIKHSYTLVEKFLFREKIICWQEIQYVTLQFVFDTEFSRFKTIYFFKACCQAQVQVQVMWGSGRSCEGVLQGV